MEKAPLTLEALYVYSRDTRERQEQDRQDNIKDHDEIKTLIRNHLAHSLPRYLALVSGVAGTVIGVLAMIAFN